MKLVEAYTVGSKYQKSDKIFQGMSGQTRKKIQIFCNLFTAVEFLKHCYPRYHSNVTLLSVTYCQVRT